MPFAVVMKSVIIAAASTLWLPAAVVPVAAQATPAMEQGQARRLSLVLAPAGNEARYRVRERLVGFELDNDAVGKTNKIEGSIVIASNGSIVSDSSKFVVDLASLTSDQERRDGYVRNRSLQTAQHPTATFVPTSLTGLSGALPRAGALQFQLVGNLTVHGVTKPATWDVKGNMTSTGAFTGTATTSFKFADFDMAIPRVPIVLSVTDNITLEYDLNLVPR